MDARASLDQRIALLYRQRPRSRFLRFCALLSTIGVVLCWSLGDFLTAEVFHERRLTNLKRFMGELVPYPLQGRDFDWDIATEWLAGMLSDRGWEAIATTLAISVAAIVMAGIASIPCSLLAARNLSTPHPFLPGSGKFSWHARAGWRAVTGGTRFLLIFLRAIPEYIWAFLLLAILGISAWPLVLALALHNAGILGKLSAEVVENLPAAPLSSLRALGASRLHIAGAAILPLALPRFLMFFFYRWETCVREATVLGMLGFVSLGFWIQDARARNHYDEMFIYILFGVILILIGDIVSAIARKVIRDVA